ncbi:MAG: YdcF family protein [Firmicutes bacterium]|nr:YdcF family protein [Bacillota bacterium]
MKALKKTVLSVAALLAVLAAFFRFALRGYGFLALVLIAVSAAAVLLVILPRKAKIVLLAFIAAFMAVFWHFEAMVLDASKGDVPERADYLIVLGAAVHGSSPSPSLRERLEAAQAFLEEHPECTAVVSGGKGSGEDMSEGSCMKSWLVSRGIGEDRVIAEEKAVSTEENLRFSADIIAKAEGEDWRDLDIAVCSSEYHLCRAAFLAEKYTGIRPALIPAETARPLLKLSNLMREACGMMINAIKR